MDAIDRQILDILSADARLPLKTIAGRVGLARSSVRSRIDRLEARGVIHGYGAKVAQGAPAVGAMMSLSLARTPDPAVVAAVCGQPQVRRCLSLAGEVDLLVELAAPDVATLNAARDRISALPGVVRATTALILKRDKDPEREA